MKYHVDRNKKVVRIRTNGEEEYTFDEILEIFSSVIRLIGKSHKW
jgi:hypothetical protein